MGGSVVGRKLNRGGGSGGGAIELGSLLSRGFSEGTDEGLVGIDVGD